MSGRVGGRGGGRDGGHGRNNLNITSAELQAMINEHVTPVVAQPRPNGITKGHYLEVKLKSNDSKQSLSSELPILRRIRSPGTGQATFMFKKFMDCKPHMFNGTNEVVSLL
jgi:hypothetical protein